MKNGTIFLDKAPVDAANVDQSLRTARAAKSDAELRIIVENGTVMKSIASLTFAAQRAGYVRIGVIEQPPVAAVSR